MLLLALAPFQVANAATDLVPANPAYQRFVAQYGPNSATLYYGVGGTVLPTASGLAQHASVAGLSPTAGEVSRYAALTTKYGQVPFKASQTITAAKLASGLGALAGGPLGIGLLALPYALDWFTDAGLVIDSATGSPMEYPPTAGCSHYSQLPNFSACGGFAPATAALPVNVYLPAGYKLKGGGTLTVGQCYAQDFCTGGGGYEWVQERGPRAALNPSQAVPTSPENISSKLLSAPARTTSEIEKILSETIKYPEIQPAPADYVRIDPVTPGQPIKSPTKTDQKTTTNPDGSKVEETKSCWIKGTVQTGASMKLSEVCNTDTVSKSPSGTVTGTTTTTTDSQNSDAANPETEQGGLCDTLVGKLLCADLDTPEEPVPQRSVSVSYNPLNLFGAGTCPQPRSYTSVVTGSTHTASFQPTCDALALLRPMFLAIAAFIAYMILLPKGND